MKAYHDKVEPYIERDISVFAKPYNARVKVIERFFREFQEELEKGMPSYIGTSIEDKPAWLKRGEKLHAEWHKN